MKIKEGIISNIRIVQRKDKFIVQERRRFLFIHYWCSPFRDYDDEGGSSAQYFDSFEIAKEKADERAKFLHLADKKITYLYYDFQ